MNNKKNWLWHLLPVLLGIGVLPAQALADECQKVYFSPDDFDHEHPLEKPHPRLVKSYSLARAGNAAEQVNMAIRFDTGYLVAACPEKARYWYRKAAGNGNKIAREWLAQHVLPEVSAPAEPDRQQASVEVTRAEPSPSKHTAPELTGIAGEVEARAASGIPAIATEVAKPVEVASGAVSGEPPRIVNAAAPDNLNATAPDSGVSGNTALVRIDRFEIVGNTLLDKAVTDGILEAYKGEGRSFSDIQRALEALEGAYRAAGYSAVHVTTPEQDVTEGAVVFIVTESVIGKVILSGNQNYDSDNIRNALPALIENTTPSARRLSENVRLANENTTRQLDVVLALSDQEGKVDAKVNVKDESPHKMFFTLDNTGNQSTGMYRTGIGYQHNNLFNLDHAATLNYATSPDHVSKVTQVSGSYRLPIYSLGDSVDLIAAHSDSNAGTSSIVGGSLLTFSGKGNVYGAHYNHYLPRRGDYTSKIIAGFDYRAYLNNCSLNFNGTPVPGGCGGSGKDLTVHPLSIAYDGTTTTASHVSNYNASLVRNIPGGNRGGTADFNAARPSPVGGAGARADYTIFRLNGSLLGALPEDFQYRVAGSAQYTSSGLVAYESFGLVGASAVRGFVERELSSDKGYVLNLEFYTPELAKAIDMQDGSLRLLAFADHARGWKVPVAGEAMDRISVGSVGIGMRLTYSKNLITRLDLARVVDAGGNARPGHSRGQVNIIATW